MEGQPSSRTIVVWLATSANASATLIETYEGLGRPLPAVRKPLVALPGEPISAETLIQAIAS
jgi:hypothetical protein